MRKNVPVKMIILLMVTMLIFLLAGCSQMSLYNLLESERESEFSLGITSINLRVNSRFDFKPVGGYLPYSYAVIEGPDPGVMDSATGTYIAPGTAGEIWVECLDGIGDRDSARVIVYEPVAADHSAFSIRIGDPDKELLVSGGMGLLSAAAGLGTITPALFSSGDQIWYTPPAALGTDYIEISDELDNSLSIMVEVLVDAGSIVLELLPGFAVLEPSASQVFTINNTTGHDLSIALSDSFGTIDAAVVSGALTSASVQYTAPAAEGTVTITVTDNDTGDSVQTDIHVQGDEGPLEITPESVQAAPGSTVVFTASGGVMPYVFSRINGSGTLEQTSPVTASATSTSVVSMIRVTDSLGNQAQGKIKKN